MEGVGARLGRSSTRYGPTTVFSGPVRKWKKRWVHVSPSNNSNNGNHTHHNHHHLPINGSTANGNNVSHLLLYKWTPLSQRDDNNNGNGNGNGNGNNSNGGDKSSAKDDTTPEEPPRRKFKYMPVAVLEEQNKAVENESAEIAENEAKPADTDPSAAEPAPRTQNFDEKPDINDVPMEENQDDGKVVRQDLNESTLDLSLGLKAHDGKSDSKTDQTRDGKLER